MVKKCKDLLNKGYFFRTFFIIPIIIKIIAGQKVIKNIMPKPTGLGASIIPKVSVKITISSGEVPITNNKTPIFIGRFNFKNLFTYLWLKFTLVKNGIVITTLDL